VPERFFFMQRPCCRWQNKETPVQGFKGQMRRGGVTLEGDTGFKEERP
jgi:hypothetical protein